jgi:hypothetical protein
MWTLLEADEQGYRLERQFASYDIETVLAALEASHQPAPAPLRNALAAG